MCAVVLAVMGGTAALVVALVTGAAVREHLRRRQVRRVRAALDEHAERWREIREARRTEYATPLGEVEDEPGARLVALGGALRRSAAARAAITVDGRTLPPALIPPRPDREVR